MIGPCRDCIFWHHSGEVHDNWGHCYKAQEMTDDGYEENTPDDEKSRMVAIGCEEEEGVFATFVTFECNEFRTKKINRGKRR
jgi:hypothetical protein